MKKIIFLISGALLFIFSLFLFKVDWVKIFQIKEPIYLVGALAIMVFAGAILSLRVNFFLKALDEKKAKIVDLVEIEFINKFFYYVLPGRINIPIKALLLNKMCQTPKSKALSITIFEFVLDISFMIFFGLIGLSLFFQKFSTISIEKIIITVIILFGIVIAFFAMPIKTFKRTFINLGKVRVGLLKKLFMYLEKIVLRLRETWPQIIFNRQMVFVVPLILISWVMTVAGNEMIFLAYGYYVPVMWVLTVTAVSLIIGGLSQIPGGIGAREVTTVVLLTFLGVDPNMAVISSVIGRLFTIAPAVIGYLYLLTLDKKILSGEWKKYFS